ncbi:hypothetical protein A1OE_1306 [Candidatus Endolissoclinum faulkneri L2]|uniref:Uncharacterized protein n=1 Tax=Candidatus Endolissoclinum faulkneri L2 TaxID=1193729 RepID=K7YSI7_9PROT|nr:hypothetical protein A1OE_1306 [Candidatus Endolissoclinum faulkneri L2]
MIYAIIDYHIMLYMDNSALSRLFIDFLIKINYTLASLYLQNTHSCYILKLHQSDI